MNKQLLITMACAYFFVLMPLAIGKFMRTFEDATWTLRGFAARKRYLG